ncbi:hypothetical protein DXG01_005401 [Tephrocybe rancida]|nr:hypothetical protein DXG01_005401 [Tephrocybe rancida]
MSDEPLQDQVKTINVSLSLTSDSGDPGVEVKCKMSPQELALLLAFPNGNPLLFNSYCHHGIAEGLQQLYSWTKPKSSELLWIHPRKDIHPQTQEEHTLYSMEYLSVTLDEAQAFHNIGAKHSSALLVVKKSTLCLILTVTPLQTPVKRSNLFAGMFYSHHHHRLAPYPPPSLLTGASRCPPPQHVTAPQDDPEQMEEHQRSAKGQTLSGGEPQAKTEGRQVNVARGRNNAGSMYGPEQRQRTPETTQHGRPWSNEVRDACPTTSDAPEQTTTTCASADARPTNPPQQHQRHAEQRSNTRRRPRTDEWMTTMRTSADACPTNPAQQHQHHMEQREYPQRDTRVPQQHQQHAESAGAPPPPRQHPDTMTTHPRPPLGTPTPPCKYTLTRQPRTPTHSSPTATRADDAPPPTARRPHTAM